jgi:hypothetical protein
MISSVPCLAALAAMEIMARAIGKDERALEYCRRRELFGQTPACVSGLGRLLPEDHVKSAVHWNEMECGGVCCIRNVCPADARFGGFCFTPVFMLVTLFIFRYKFRVITDIRGISG